MAVSIRISGIKELQAKLAKMGSEVPTKVVTDAAKAGGNVLIEFAGQNINQNFTSRSGALKRSLKVVVTRHGYVRAGSYALVYNRIHEYGGTIHPKVASRLSWIGEDGNRIFAKSVKIPARPYMRPAFDEHQDDIARAMADVVKEYLDSV